MKLHFYKSGEGEPLIIIHGLFGSGDNWISLAKQFAEHYTVYLLDMRNHGHSPHDEVFNYDVMAEDVHAFMNDEQIMYAHFIGHSMGGKVIMRHAQRWPDRVEKLVVADMGVKSYPPHHDRILEALNKIDGQIITSRKQAGTILEEYIQEESVRQFLMKNLYWKEKGLLKWRMNVPVITRSMPSILEAVPDGVVEAETMFIRGDQSGYILDEDKFFIDKIFPNSTLETIANAGHWLHAEAPEQFYSMVNAFLEG
ncbi:MAG: alpha/beta fold hydrolase [Flavobacteriales bacterium]|nr:alpha/beta fold hydrolase [Flavobacteriales bacterium]